MTTTNPYCLGCCNCDFSSFQDGKKIDRLLNGSFITVGKTRKYIVKRSIRTWRYYKENRRTSQSTGLLKSEAYSLLTKGDEIPYYVDTSSGNYCLFRTYDENDRTVIDENMQKICEVVDRFPDIIVIASCGGHEPSFYKEMDEKNNRAPEGEWWFALMLLEEKENIPTDVAIKSYKRIVKSLKCDEIQKTASKTDECRIRIDGKNIDPDMIATKMLKENINLIPKKCKFQW